MLWKTLEPAGCCIAAPWTTPNTGINNKELIWLILYGKNEKVNYFDNDHIFHILSSMPHRGVYQQGLGSLKPEVWHGFAQWCRWFLWFHFLRRTVFYWFGNLRMCCLRFRGVSCKLFFQFPELLFNIFIFNIYKLKCSWCYQSQDWTMVKSM